jgi:hypothetical protein
LTETSPSGWIGSWKMEIGAVVFSPELEILINVIEDLVF